ncbi:hypothetical protein IU500_06960 [Nocardia terpenica]|uniref:HK97 family phage prohead protease n=1 Tax=Nocardia terpenica TaxID=455432 RepID=UPI0018938685|nr:hypothetical protein [Nocardia terpenica]MBF6060516.1 hypothetical protein [Nocardia terpenica]MBF6103776.1 hypothetical protein [Nocardia terpenica]MBF6111850.1 hypothetical protein [Nocardia terpenica]MBF6117997.1 hypothetical protein [Nocardia terpenica]MBF6155277.1 hypothetical protein [Nocardia terpenica]
MAAITSADTTLDDAPYGGFEAILSTPALDRDGDQLRTSEWKTPLPDHITVDVDHEMSVRGTVGSATPYLDDDGNLRIRAKFASTATAQEVRTLITEGHIKTVSVAFMTDKAAAKDGRPSRELLNAGVVSVPSNREALILNAKAGARNSASDRALIQSVHDAASQLGAACAPGDDTGYEDGANMRSTPAAETKSAETPTVLDFPTFVARLSELLAEATSASSNSAGTPQNSRDHSPTTSADPPADAAPHGPTEAAGAAADAAEESTDAVAAAQAELGARLALLSLTENALSDSEIP